ncbi:MAG TPA: putative O-glycosylation ligase, exosortase A system-associated [Methylomirabilota bacterium]|nr:putative O-glycosylation ligase, exosortase A system-associated [Methylomirabilota bacterium]
MSGIRDVAFLIVITGLTPVSFFRPWLGVLAWSWIAYMAPHMLTWGFGQRLPVAMMIGGATLLGFIFTRDKQPLPRAAVVPLLVLFAIDITMTSLLAIEPGLAWGKWDWVVKSLLMSFVTMSLFQDRHRLRWLYMVMALSLGFYGLKGGIWVLKTGGAERVFGPEGTFFGDNNELGLALCMMLPFLIYLSREEPRPWLKRLMRVTFAFTIIAILFTYSRGALLGLLAIAALLIWRSPWRTLAIATALGLALVITPLLPDKWWGRMDTITEENQDTSIQGRLEAWKTATNLAMDRPLTGGGFRVLWNNYTWDRYFGPGYLKARDAHSIYFEVLSEHGFIGLALYLLIVATTLISLQRIRLRWRRHPDHGYLASYAEMTQLALAPYLVAGSFLSLAYFDLYLHLLATSAILQTLSWRAGRAEVLAPATTPTTPTGALAVRTHRIPVPVRVPRVVPRRTVPSLKRARHA